MKPNPVFAEKIPFLRRCGACMSGGAHEGWNGGEKKPVLAALVGPRAVVD